MADEHWPLEAVQEGLLTKNEASKVEQVVHDLLGPDQKIVAVEKKVVVSVQQLSQNSCKLSVERCFGMLVSPGRNGKSKFKRSHNFTN